MTSPPKLSKIFVLTTLISQSLTSKEQKIQDLERALTDQREASGKSISEIISKLKLLFKEYEKSLNEFGVRPASLPADIGLSEFMEWIEAESKRSLRLFLVLMILLQPSLLKAFRSFFAISTAWIL
jgi:hypothetical protein